MTVFHFSAALIILIIVSGFVSEMMAERERTKIHIACITAGGTAKTEGFGGNKRTWCELMRKEHKP